MNSILKKAMFVLIMSVSNLSAWEYAVTLTCRVGDHSQPWTQCVEKFVVNGTIWSRMDIAREFSRDWDIYFGVEEHFDLKVYGGNENNIMIVKIEDKEGNQVFYRESDNSYVPIRVEN